jgi:signal transduction histidine kinase/integral membrane sensor domain MASE1
MERLTNTHQHVSFSQWGRAAIVYLVLGAAGIVFAIAPSYASPIFPAAGFAVAYLLWAGRGAWPAVWLGSVALNLGIALQNGNLGWHSAALAMGIASAATLQALLARFLVERSVGSSWRAMEEQAQILRSLVLAGPVACLVASSLAVGMLWWGQMVPGGDYANVWWNWWSGDVLGVLVVMPMSLAIFARHQANWKGRLLTLLPPMLVALGVVAGAFVVAAKWERTRDIQTIGRHGEEVSKLLAQRFIAHQEALSALRRLFEVTPDMNHTKFEYFTRITLQDNPDIFALSINPFVQAAQRSAFERDMERRAAVPGFEVRERDSQSRLVRAGDRAHYVPVGLIAPLEGNRPAVGFDINSDGVRHEAIEHARRSAAPAVTAAVQLVQENQKRVGVLLLHPAYVAMPSQDARTGTLLGFAVGVIKVDQMVDIAIGGVVNPGLVVRIDDVQASADGALLYSSHPGATVPQSEYLWQQDILMADRSWRLSVYPTPDFMGSRSHWTTLLVGVGGLALVALLQVLLLVTTGQTAVVQRKVREQTEKLQVTSAAMEDQNAQLNVLFTLSPDGLVAFSADGTVRFVNPAFLEMTGIPQAVVEGHGEAVLNDMLRDRCVTPSAFTGIAACFHEVGMPLTHLSLELKTPEAKVLQLVGVYSKASSIVRILYLRDVTHETEVENLKNEFLSTAAHELRTPMASIYGFAEVLLTQDLEDSDRKEMLDIIYRQSSLMASILNELLDLARIEARRGKDFVLERVVVRTLVDKVVHEFKPPADRQAPLVRSSTMELAILADDKKARQAILNVLSNAYKYSPAGGAVEIELLARTQAGEAAQVGIRVLDHGIGMTPEQQARIFERFYRADTSGKIPGTGLGMSIVHEIIALLGGTVEISSKPGSGTTVTLWLPAATQPPTQM